MSKDPRVYLAQILECIEKIERFTVGGEAQFLREAMVQDAVIRNFEVIGEAAKRIGDAYRTAHLGIPWRALGGLRDVLIHQYEGVDLERVWNIVATELPPLKERSPHFFHLSTPWSVNSLVRTIRRGTCEAATRRRQGPTMAVDHGWRGGSCTGSNRPALAYVSVPALCLAAY
jgi:uncharacterized protein with HEPN domain